MPSTLNINKIAEQCVMCGMCLPHCPTYQISHHEAESPRGRISLIKAYSEQHLQSSSALQTHLLSCTTCLKCEQVCPANVSYEKLIDHGRMLYHTELSFFTRLQQSVAISILTTNLGHRIISLAKRISKFLPSKFHLVQILELADNSSKISVHGNHSKTITVLPGCTGNIFDQQTLNSISNVLGALGYNASIPDDILCCGALAQHSGLPDISLKHKLATELFLKNHFSKEYLSFASGCGRQYNKLLSNADIQHYDILNWLLEQTHVNSLELKPLNANVLIHLPCTVDQDNEHLCQQLLSLIPEVKLSTFNDNVSCCGAGGAQLLSPMDSNKKLLTAKIDTIKSLQPDIIVSSNIGCSMYLQTGLKNTDLDIEVIHPVTLLSRQLNQKT